MEREVYLLSGLGADQRVFEYLDLSAFKVNYIQWISPYKNESVNSYAKRLCEQIHSPKPLLIGVSFGGMMAIEIAKLIEVEKVIQISSAKLNSEIPLLYRIIGQLGLNRLVHGLLLKRVNVVTYWFFGVTNREDKALLKAIIESTDITFLRWAIHQIVNWKQEVVLNNVIQIHGSHDHLLPISHPDFIIERGGHLMIMNRASEINRILSACIKVI